MKKIAIQALALSAKEETVLKSLRSSTKPQKISQIAQTAQLPHSTTSFVLRSLEKRRLARRVREAGHFCWEYRDTLELLEPDSGFLDTTSLSVKSGMPKLVQEFMDMLKPSAHQRLYAIQGAGIASDIITKIDTRLMQSIHEQVRRKKIVIEGIISDSVYELFNKMPIEQLKSHVGRMTIVHVLADEMLDFPLDVFLLGRKVFLVDYGKEKLVKIEDAGLSKVFRSLFLLAEQQGRRIDLNQHLEALIAHREKMRS